MERFTWRRLGDKTTPLDELIRFLNSRLTKLAFILGAVIDDLRTVSSFSNGVTQPSIYGARLWIEKNTAPTTISHFRDGEEGQIFTLWATTPNTTVANSGTIRTKTGANVALNANSVMMFGTADGTLWREL